MKKNKGIAAAVALSALLTFSGCTVVNVANVGNVDGDLIYVGQYKYTMELKKNEIAQRLGDVGSDANIWDMELDGQKAGDVLKQEAFDDCANILVQARKAKEMGLALSSDDKKEMSDYKGQLIKAYGKEQYESFLKEYGMTEEQYDEMQENQFLANKLKEKMIAEDESLKNVSDEEINKELNDNYMKAKHILFKDPANVEEGVNAQDVSKAKADAALAQIKGGADFDAIMNELSEDGRGEDGTLSNPNGYLFQDNQMVKPFEEAVKKLAVDQVTDEPVRVESSNYSGYHIIKKIAFTDEDKETAKKSVIEKKYEDMVKQWASEMNIEKKDNKIAKVKIEEEK